MIHSLPLDLGTFAKLQQIYIREGKAVKTQLDLFHQQSHSGSQDRLRAFPSTYHEKIEKNMIVAKSGRLKKNKTGMDTNLLSQNNSPLSTH